MLDICFKNALLRLYINFQSHGTFSIQYAHLEAEVMVGVKLLCDLSDVDATSQSGNERRWPKQARTSSLQSVITSIPTCLLQSRKAYSLGIHNFSVPPEVFVLYLGVPCDRTSLQFQHYQYAGCLSLRLLALIPWVLHRETRKLSTTTSHA